MEEKMETFLYGDKRERQCTGDISLLWLFDASKNAHRYLSFFLCRFLKQFFFPGRFYGQLFFSCQYPRTVFAFHTVFFSEILLSCFFPKPFCRDLTTAVRFIPPRSIDHVFLCSVFWSLFRSKSRTFFFFFSIMTCCPPICMEHMYMLLFGTSSIKKDVCVKAMQS